MVDEVRLVKPAASLRDAYIDFYEDWKRSGEKMVPWVVQREPYDFAAYIAYLQAEDADDKLASPDLVPHSTYWLLDDAQRVVGAVNIRHRLNERLLNRGGHIGFGIRPSDRRKGFAAALLAQALGIVRNMGVERALVTCDRDNIGSERTIRRNGGVFESEFVEESGNVVKRFWIAARG